MAVIDWKAVYETGIQSLDKEHRQLVAQINRLYEALRDKRSDEVLDDCLQMLEEYTRLHFAHEEKLLAAYGFPGLAAHRATHEELRQSVAQLKQRSAAGSREELARELLKFLRHWVLEHIVEVDKQYGPYLESRAGRFVD